MSPEQLRGENNKRRILKKYNRFYKNVVVLNAYATSFLFVFVFVFFIIIIICIYFFLWQRYRTCSLIAPLCILLADSHSGWLLAFVRPSEPPSQTRAVVLAREKNKLPHPCFLQVSGQMCFEVRGRRTISSSGFPITVTLQCFPVFCCCLVFSGFVLSCFLH